MVHVRSDALAELERALEEPRPERLAAAVQGVVGALSRARGPTRDELAVGAVERLRRGRRFEEVLEVADAALSLAVDAPRLRTQYAQALVETGRLGAAHAVLSEMRGAGAVSERLEVEGLLGRVHKQRYQDALDGSASEARRSLALAIARYRDAYACFGVDALWHGINAVALLTEAARVGAGPIGAAGEAARIASEVRAAVERMEAPGPWDRATLAEAHVALGDFDAAAREIERYVLAAGDAFMLASTWRQLRDVWRLDPTVEAQRRILRLLEAAVLRRRGGTIAVASSEVASAAEETAPAGLEKVFGDESYRTLAWLREGFTRARAVARVRSRFGRTLGTGVLVRGELLHASWAGRRLLVTNHHVVNADGRLGDRRVARPGEVEVVFEALERPVACGAPELLFESSARPLDTRPPEGLDTAVLALDAAVDVGVDLEPADRLPEEGDGVLVVGHAGGLELAFSFQDNRLVARDESLLHYRSPTDPGSSGSPLFDEQWRLIGLHHAGLDALPSIADPSTTVAANEGFTWGAIRGAVARSIDAGG